MKKFIINKNTLFAFGILLFIGIWFLIAEIVGDKQFIFPSPIETFQYVGVLLKKKTTYEYIGGTLLRMIIGFFSSFILAILLGSLSGNSKKIQYILKPIMVILKTIPTATLVFLFLVISGAKNAPIYIVVLISLPILYEATLGGFLNIDKEIVEASMIDGANIMDQTLKVKFPLASSYILVGVASSFALSFKIEIMAEVITGATKGGLGSAISGAQKAGDGSMVPIFAYSLIAVVIILIIDIVTTFIKNKLTSTTK